MLQISLQWQRNHVQLLSQECILKAWHSWFYPQGKGKLQTRSFSRNGSDSWSPQADLTLSLCGVLTQTYCPQQARFLLLQTLIASKLLSLHKNHLNFLGLQTWLLHGKLRAENVVNGLNLPVGRDKLAENIFVAKKRLNSQWDTTIKSINPFFTQDFSLRHGHSCLLSLKNQSRFMGPL